MGNKNNKHSENSEIMTTTEALNVGTAIAEGLQDGLSDVETVVNENNNVESTVETPEEPEEPENNESENTNVEPTIETSENLENYEDGSVTPGAVRNCKRLNLRKEPSKSSEVLCVLLEDESVLIDLEKSTDDFYNISARGIDGYCMKQFIEII